jgi:hypothetical protein
MFLNFLKKYVPQLKPAIKLYQAIIVTPYFKQGKNNQIKPAIKTSSQTRK